MMLALKIELLTGRYVASEYNDRQTAEWPLHPARMFSALVATWMENAEQARTDERRVLELLEAAGPPSIHASPASHRKTMTHYVPVNDTRVRQSLQKYRDALEAAQHAHRAAQQNYDASIDPESRNKFHKALKKTATALNKAETKLAEETKKRLAQMKTLNKSAMKDACSMLPDNRVRQARFFPSVTPESPVVHLIWNCDIPAEERDILQVLAKRVVRLGHSSSLVHMSITATAPDPNWVPDDHGDTVLRVIGDGQIDALEKEWQQHRETEPRVLPCRFQRYRNQKVSTRKDTIHSIFTEDWIVFRRVGGPKLPIGRCADVAGAFRGALLHWAEDPPGELLSGHLRDGKPTKKPHTAFVPLPFVGHRHADGRIMGVAVVLPADAADPERKEVFRAIGRWEASHRIDDEEAPVVDLQLGRTGVLELERISWGTAHQTTLRPLTWCRPSTRWLSVTPVALDRNPGNLYASDPQRATEAYATAADIIGTACTRIGLPKPMEIAVLPSATMPGTIKARQFPAFPAKPGNIQRAKVHALMRFEEPVAGPVLLGAGRFFGLGLFRPISEEEM